MNRRFLLLILLATAVVPYFINLNATSIIDANEAFYSETPREMIESGDFINPTFNYEPRVNKPPLSYWVVAGFYRLFGVSLGAARLPIALGAMLILASVFLIGRRVFGPDAGLLAAITLAITPRMLFFSRRIIIDVYTAMFLSLTLLFFVLAEVEPKRRRLWLVLMYVAVGLGVLTKGPIAALLPALVFVCYFAAAGRLAVLRSAMLPAGALIVAAVVLPYYVVLYAQNGWSDIAAFVVRENLTRYVEGVGTPSRGLLFYFPVVFADLYFPWSLLLPVALALVPWRRMSAVAARSTWSNFARGGPFNPASTSDLTLLLGLWIAVIVLFFSISRTKQDLYVLPFVAGAAPLVGGLLDQLFRSLALRRLVRVSHWALSATAVVVLALGLAIAWFLFVVGEPLYLPSAMAAGAATAMSALVALGMVVRRRAFAGVLVLAGAVLLFHWFLVLRLMPEFERYKPVPQLARVILDAAGPSAVVATYRISVPSLVFYVKRHVTELSDEQQFEAFLRAQPDVFCVMPEEAYAAIAPRLPASTYVAASAPRFDSRLADFLDRKPLRRLLLVATRARTK